MPQLTVQEYRARQCAYEKKRLARDPRLSLLKNSKQRSRQFNIPFDIELEDIVIPTVCPVLKVPLVRGTYYGPSLDRIIPELGYVKGNIQVISHKANAMKQNATKEELINFSQWVLQSTH